MLIFLYFLLGYILTNTFKHPFIAMALLFPACLYTGWGDYTAVLSGCVLSKSGLYVMLTIGVLNFFMGIIMIDFFRLLSLLAMAMGYELMLKKIFGLVYIVEKA